MTTTKRPDELNHEAIELVRKAAFALSPAEQYRLAFFIAENVGYVLEREPEHPDSPHTPAPQPPVEGLREELSDPNIVHLNMLRGDIAKPTREQIKHLYPELFSSDPAIITDFDRFYGDPVERFKAMADANHEGPIDVAHFKMWCRIAEREIRHARALASPPLTAGASSELRRVWLNRLNAIAPAVENLAGHQEQCDFDGVMVKVSRQALDEVLNAVNDLAVSFVTAPTTLTEQPSEAQPSAPDVREASERVLQSLNALASGLLSPDQNETSTAMAAEAARAIEDATIIHDFLSAPPVADREAIARAFYEMQPANDRSDENGDPIPWNGLADFCREIHYEEATKFLALLSAQPAKGER